MMVSAQALSLLKFSNGKISVFSQAYSVQLSYTRHVVTVRLYLNLGSTAFKLRYDLGSFLSAGNVSDMHFVR